MHLTGAVADANADSQRPLSHDGSQKRWAGLRESGSRSWASPSRPTQTTFDHRPPYGSRPASSTAAPPGAHDPAAGGNARKVLPDLVVVPTVEEALQGADAAVVATEWPMYCDWTGLALRDTMRHPLINRRSAAAPRGRAPWAGYMVHRLGDGVSAGERIR